MNRKSLQILVILIGLLSLVPFAAAQSDCGDTYTVQPGDNLTRIANICDTTVEELRAANPTVFSVITPGQVLNLPQPQFTPSVTVNPSDGPVGTTVNVVANGFPGSADVRVGMGRAGEAALVSAQAVTNVNGALSVNLTVPAGAQPTENLFATVQTLDGDVSATSGAFTVSGESFGTGGPQSSTLTGLAAPPPPFGVGIGGALFDRVNIYMVAPGDDGAQGPRVGCGDSLIPVQIAVSPTVAPLTAGVNALLRNSADSYGLTELTNPVADSGLTVDQILIVNGEAIINLSGQYTSAGVCDDARVESQLIATALQYNTVSTVSIFVNGQEIGNLLR